MLPLSFSVAAHSNNRFNVNDMKAQMWADSVMATLSDDEKIGQLFIFTTKAQDTPALRTALLKQIIRPFGFAFMLVFDFLLG